MIEYLSLIISFIALGISGISFYYLHLQGPKIKIEHLKEETVHFMFLESAKKNGFPLEKEHVLAVTNNGNKTGLLRNILVRTLKERSIDEIHQGSLKISHGDEYIDTNEPLPIKGKESIVINFCYILDHPSDEHYIEVTYDTSFFSRIFQKTEIIWRSNK